MLFLYIGSLDLGSASRVGHYVCAHFGSMLPDAPHAPTNFAGLYGQDPCLCPVTMCWLSVNSQCNSRKAFLHRKDSFEKRIKRQPCPCPLPAGEFQYCTVSADVEEEGGQKQPEAAQKQRACAC